MISTGHVVPELIQNVSLSELVAIGYDSPRCSAFAEAGRRYAMGLLFGCGAVLAMAVRIESRAA